MSSAARDIALNFGGHAAVTSVSCAAAGNCVVAGDYGYLTASSNYRPFVASEVNGTWGTAKQVPGTGTLNAGRGAGLNVLSCATASFCGAGWFYTDGTGHVQAFVVSWR